MKQKSKNLKIRKYRSETRNMKCMSPSLENSIYRRFTYWEVILLHWFGTFSGQ